MTYLSFLSSQYSSLKIKLQLVELCYAVAEVRSYTLILTKARIVRQRIPRDSSLYESINRAYNTLKPDVSTTPWQPQATVPSEYRSL